MSTTPPPQSQPQLSTRQETLAIIVVSYGSALVILGAVLALLGAELTVPPIWMLLTVLAATIAAWALAVSMPVPATSGSSDAAVQALTMVRLAVLEAPAIVGFALAFVATPTNLLIYLLPAIFAVGGIVLLARPSVIRARVERASTTRL